MGRARFCARDIRQADRGDEDVQLKLADTYIALGDVSLETEKFDQAGLALKGELLPRSPRQIAKAHYSRSMVLDLTSGCLGDAITHAEHALESVECRLGELTSPSTAPAAAPPPRPKGKAKAMGTTRLMRSMSATRTEAETKELAGQKEDLALKMIWSQAPAAINTSCILRTRSFRARNWHYVASEIRRACRLETRGCSVAIGRAPGPASRRARSRHSSGANSHLAQLYGCGIALGRAASSRVHISRWIYILYGCALFSKTWIEVSGSGPRNIASTSRWSWWSP
ncbi:hypothetical protein C8R44DRAFT_879099 [Mycena epipterygia]|nr:hypothetical protein C8R44DRAFT_879099 [Mycena epipterygia]